MHAVQARISQIQARLGAPAAATNRSTASADSFGAVLAGALTSGAIPASSAATVRAPGSYGPIVPPPELASHGNGQIPTAQLVPIGDGSERLYAPAADAFKRMTSDAWRAGIDLKVNDGYRSLSQQQTMAAEVGLYRDGGRAAVPGTSTHGWGLSVDIDTDGGATEWLRSNAARYGFVEDVAREPWHWTYRPDA